MPVGIIFFEPFLGAVIGAGALSARLRDIGISDGFMKGLADN
jgi:uncharacterized membrane protein